MVGPAEERAIARAAEEGRTPGSRRGAFQGTRAAGGKRHGKSSVQQEHDEVVAVHIIGIHAADLIQECANAVAAGTSVKELSMMSRPPAQIHSYHGHKIGWMPWFHYAGPLCWILAELSGGGYLETHLQLSY